MKQLKQQQGGTVLGIIIGLVIGLGIAVGVAVTINKTPVPFVNKGGRIDRTDSGQTPDLNKSLYGNREPARQAAKQFQKEPPATDDAAQAAANAEANGKNGAADKAAKAADKPADKVADKGAAAAKADESAKSADATKTATGDAAKADAGEEKWTYYLQAGAFREQADAEAAKAKLALMGIETKISERTSDNGTLYRVRVGPFAQADAMNKVRSKLSDNGVDVAVVRIPK